MPFVEPFDLLCCRFRRTGRRIQRTEKTLSKGMGSWWRDGFIRRAKSVSSSRKCDRVVSHLFSTALDGSVRVWVLQGMLFSCLISSTSSQRPKNVYSSALHINNIYAKKRGIGKKLILTIRAVMLGELCGPSLQVTSTEPRGGATTATISVSLLWGPGSIPGCWADVCGFLKPPESDQYWKVRLHGAFSITHKALGLRPTCARPIKAATTRHGSTSNSSIGAALNHITKDTIDEFSSCAVPLRPAERRISDIMSDHSLSSDIATIRTRLTVPCGTCTSSPSDLMTLLFQFICTHASVPLFASFSPVVDHSYRMHIHHEHLDTA